MRRLSLKVTALIVGLSATSDSLIGLWDADFRQVAILSMEKKRKPPADGFREIRVEGTVRT